MGNAQRQDTLEGTDGTEAAPADDGTLAANDDLVRCVMSGDYIPRAEAVMVTLGPGRRRWIRRDLTNAGR